MSLGSTLGKDLIENFRLRVELAIIAKINDRRTLPEERTGLRLARVILNAEAEKFTAGIAE